ncbi:helix-turn-helix domain-containing protein [Nitrosomonas sp.]|nr:helix-turn-helix domain-containing protein [Nitrosomonas sp.]MDP1786265.1 helix-turn-helix domain-containing protein [Nitrosomonas sp.]
MEKVSLPLPEIRCLSKQEAASYLGIGVTLLSELDIPFVKLGRRCLYDRVDLDIWIEE